MAITCLLVAPDLAQHGAEPLVGHDGALLDTGDLIEEDLAGQRVARVADLDPSVVMLMDAAASLRANAAT